LCPILLRRHLSLLLALMRVALLLLLLLLLSSVLLRVLLRKLSVLLQRRDSLLLCSGRSCVDLRLLLCLLLLGVGSIRVPSVS
jgi:hypothetical protein